MSVFWCFEIIIVQSSLRVESGQLLYVAWSEHDLYLKARSFPPQGFHITEENKLIFFSIELYVAKCPQPVAICQICSQWLFWLVGMLTPATPPSSLKCYM